MELTYHAHSKYFTEIYHFRPNSILMPLDKMQFGLQICSEIKYNTGSLDQIL